MNGRRERGFTLVEMLAVVALIALLIGILLPSLSRSIRKATATVCLHNLHELDQALHTYRLDHRGLLPDVSAGFSGGRSGAVDDVHSAAWYGRLIPAYLPDTRVLICPADPFGSVVDTGVSLERQSDPGNLSSYGMNDVIRLSGRLNLDRFSPRRPNETLLLADMGPDAVPSNRRNMEGAAGLYRSSGRLPWDDNYDVGAAGLKMSWMTERHLGRINVLTVGGSIMSVPTRVLMGERIRSYYGDCAGGGCPLCNEFDIPHYSFASSRIYWWTGSLVNAAE